MCNNTNGVDSEVMAVIRKQLDKIEGVSVVHEHLSVAVEHIDIAVEDGKWDIDDLMNASDELTFCIAVIRDTIEGYSDLFLLKLTMLRDNLEMKLQMNNLRMTKG